MNCQSEGILTSTYEVCSYDVDPYKKLSIRNVCRFFQESAWKHAEMLGVGYSQFVITGRLWVLSRLSISVNEYPVWGEKITVHTWPSGFESLFAFRDYELKNSAGKILICGRSAWIVLDQKRRRPQRIESILDKLPDPGKRNEFNVNTVKIDELRSNSTLSAVKSQYSDLDMNGHVNNAAYVEWVVNSYSEEFHKDYEIKNISVNFLAETLVNEEVNILSEKKEDLQTGLHSLRKNGDNTEVCRVITGWKKRTIS